MLIRLLDNTGVVPLVHTIGKCGRAPDSVQVRVNESSSVRLNVPEVTAIFIVGGTGERNKMMGLMAEQSKIHNIHQII